MWYLSVNSSAIKRAGFDIRSQSVSPRSGGRATSRLVDLEQRNLLCVNMRMMNAVESLYKDQVTMQRPKSDTGGYNEHTY